MTRLVRVPEEHSLRRYNDVDTNELAEQERRRIGTFSTIEAYSSLRNSEHHKPLQSVSSSNFLSIVLIALNDNSDLSSQCAKGGIVFNAKGAMNSPSLMWTPAECFPTV